MTEGQMLYLILVVVAFVIFAGTLMRTMLLTGDARPAEPEHTADDDRSLTQRRPAH
jgi:hypothetical protein